MRKVTKAPEGEAGYSVEGLSGTYDETSSKRLQYLNAEGALELPADGVLAEVNPERHNFDLRGE
jgi:hypothetical protein